MTNKSFTYTLPVTNCYNCPHWDKEDGVVICNLSAGSIEEANEIIQLNKVQLTGSCPGIKVYEDSTSQ